MLIVAGLFAFVLMHGFAAAATQAAIPASDHTIGDAFSKILLLLLLVLLVAKIGGDLFERIGQPAVLGELVFGILLGNLSLINTPVLNHFTDQVLHDPKVDLFMSLLSEIGVVLLLFETGVCATVSEMLSVGLSSFLVAVAGVIAPMVLGFGVGVIFIPDESWPVHLFLGTVLAATSVGITARVLTDLGKMHLRESKIILGAAVIDDVLGLIVLAVVQGIVKSTGTNQALGAWPIIWIVVKASLFFFGAIWLGTHVSRRLYRVATFLQVKGVLLALTLVWCFLISYLGTLVGLAPIVGAFAGGLVLEHATFRDWEGRERELEELLSPLTTFLVPVFFVYMGMKLQLTIFADTSVLFFALLLTLAAIAGKQVCGLATAERGLNRVAIGVGMMPRGEVGLIVAGIGASLRTPQGHTVISSAAFSSSVIMVVLTTVLTPPLLKWALERKRPPAV